MHQIAVKRHLIEQRFHPNSGWQVTVDLDVMELGKGVQNAEEKRRTAEHHRKWMQDNGVTVHIHKTGRRTDILASHHIHGIYVIECEGDTSKQREQALYSALGQILLQMDDLTRRFAIAFPDSEAWTKQVLKLPKAVRDALRLTVFMVATNHVKEK